MEGLNKIFWNIATSVQKKSHETAFTKCDLLQVKYYYRKYETKSQFQTFSEAAGISSSNQREPKKFLGQEEINKPLWLNFYPFFKPKFN